MKYYIKEVVASALELAEGKPGLCWLIGFQTWHTVSNQVKKYIGAVEISTPEHTST